ncbi:hypothetical protein PoB_007122800 [Plakobranchus ocellatus]|uniref:Period n=1 Tax=Plakobranchus ocellatus TaxID=259542 RepID=A0AAV4DKX9_9GAST|nr:hypothetical protein PoB_007122800 [Plakobranchus ocellatus]
MQSSIASFTHLTNTLNLVNAQGVLGVLSPAASVRFLEMIHPEDLDGVLHFTFKDAPSGEEDVPRPLATDIVGISAEEKPNIFDALVMSMKHRASRPDSLLDHDGAGQKGNRHRKHRRSHNHNKKSATKVKDYQETNTKPYGDVEVVEMLLAIKKPEQPVQHVFIG